jgi:hypothetical protein
MCPQPERTPLTNACRFILPDYPNTTRFLTPEERTIATNRLRESIVSHGIPRSSLLSGLVAALRDYKLYLLAFVPSSFALECLTNGIAIY